MLVFQSLIEWHSWGQWSICTASCDFGIKLRKRSCKNSNGIAFRDFDCAGEPLELDECYAGLCTTGNQRSDYICEHIVIFFSKHSF